MDNSAGLRRHRDRGRAAVGLRICRISARHEGEREQDYRRHACGQAGNRVAWPHFSSPDRSQHSHQTQTREEPARAIPRHPAVMKQAGRGGHRERGCGHRSVWRDRGLSEVAGDPRNGCARKCDCIAKSSSWRDRDIEGSRLACLHRRGLRGCAQGEVPGSDGGVHRRRRAAGKTAVSGIGGGKRMRTGRQSAGSECRHSRAVQRSRSNDRVCVLELDLACRCSPC